MFARRIKFQCKYKLNFAWSFGRHCFRFCRQVESKFKEISLLLLPSPSWSSSANLLFITYQLATTAAAAETNQLDYALGYKKLFSPPLLSSSGFSIRSRVFKSNTRSQLFYANCDALVVTPRVRHWKSRAHECPRSDIRKRSWATVSPWPPDWREWKVFQALFLRIYVLELVAKII